MTQRKPHRESQPLKICVLCGAPYDPGPWKARAEKRRYCSQQCFGNVTRALKLRRPEKEVLRDLYEIQRLSSTEIGKRFGVGRGTVGRWLNAYGISIHLGHHTLKVRGISPPTADELFHLIHEEHIPYDLIGQRYGVCSHTVSSWIKQHRIRRPSSVETRKGFIAELPDQETLAQLYEAGSTLEDIAETYGVGRSTISRLCESFGITKRCDGFNNGVRYRCNDNTMVRSVYEMRTANWLLAHSVEFAYGPRLPFNRRWCADFFANGWYIEIWGVIGSRRYDERKRRKIVSYKNYGCPLIELLPMHFSIRTHIMEARLGRTLLPPCEGQQTLFPVDR